VRSCFSNELIQFRVGGAYLFMNFALERPTQAYWSSSIMEWSIQKMRKILH